MVIKKYVRTLFAGVLVTLVVGGSLAASKRAQRNVYCQNAQGQCNVASVYTTIFVSGAPSTNNPCPSLGAGRYGTSPSTANCPQNNASIQVYQTDNP
ncbi:MAG: hypothetical protein QHC79_25625 [Pseudosphingobacterium sp.]|nr:hypothetical protein [Pseudosphingobacterium sp.]